MFEWYNNYSYTRKNYNLNKKIHTVLNENKTTWPPPKHKIVYFALSQLLVGILRLFKVLIRTLGMKTQRHLFHSFIMTLFNYCAVIRVHKSVSGIGPLYMQDMFKKFFTNMGIRSEGCLALQRCNTFKHGTNSRCKTLEYPLK